MFVVVMFFVNPSIDGGNGSGVLELQLSFQKNMGIEIINRWGKSGIDNFKKWIFTDTIYALTYSLFFASLILFLSEMKNRKFSSKNVFFVCLAICSGAFDFIENSMELSFINDPYGYSGRLFFMHSVVAILKWAAVIVVVTYIGFLLAEKIKSMRKFI